MHALEMLDYHGTGIIAITGDNYSTPFPDSTAQAGSPPHLAHPNNLVPAGFSGDLCSGCYTISPSTLFLQQFFWLPNGEQQHFIL